jgi:hypothetical protein
MLNVWSPDDPPLGKPFAGYPRVVELIFKKPTDGARISCSIDPALKGVIVVVPNTVFSRSATKGEYELPRRLPAGTYELRAYHPDHGRAAAKVEIGHNEDAVLVDLVLR